MLSKKKQDDDEIKAFLGKGTEFEGKLVFSGSVRLDGRFKGDIMGGGTLVIGEGAHIEATISVDNLLVGGELHGSAEAKKRVEIFKTGKFFGTITSPVFVIQDGGVFEGDCRMVKGQAKEA
jgi:cytoskeletal protein CcmA (bactofilin family)